MPIQIIIEQASGLNAVMESPGFGGHLSFDALAKAIRRLDQTTRPPETFLSYTRFVFRGERFLIWRNPGSDVAPVKISDIKPKDYNFKRVYGSGEWLYGFRTVTDLYAIDNLRLYAPGLFQENAHEKHGN